MGKPLLFLHIGIPKTGSTALQLYFVNHAKPMLEQGLYYPDTDGTFPRCQELGLTSGNGYPLALICQQFASAPDQLRLQARQWISSLMMESNASSFKALLLSCETLSTLNKGQWEILQDVVQEFFDLRVVAFHREPYAWLFSSWLQGVKCDGAQGWLGEGEPDRDWLALILPKMLGDDLFNKTIYLSYEECRVDIVSAFFTAIGFPLLCPTNKHKLTQALNPSLTAQELTVMLLINRLTKGDPAFGQCFATKAIGRSTEVKCYFYTPAVDKMLDDFLSLNGVTRQMQCRKRQPLVVSEEVWLETQSVSGALLKAILSTLKAYYNKRLRDPITRAQEVANHYNNSFFRARVPDSFDVMAYLLRNIDVLLADIDPYKHYVDYGCAEGRHFTWVCLVAEVGIGG